MLILGIDGGGTKTSCTLFEIDSDLSGNTTSDTRYMPKDDASLANSLAPRALGSLRLPTCHWAQAGTEGMQDVLSKAIAWADERAGAASFGIAYGICGYGEGAEISQTIEAVCRTVAGGREHLIVNDVEAAWAGSLALQDGIVIIAGTGSIAFGSRHGQQMRCGGWDYLLGDEGSGGWMGKELLYAFTRQADGRRPKGPLFDLVTQKLSLDDPFDLISFAHEHFGSRATISALSPLVTEAAKAGDLDALEIFATAAQQEAELVSTIATNLFQSEDGTIPVSYVGGTFAAGSLVLDPLAEALPRQCVLTQPLFGPEAGAALLLATQVGLI
ncbi:BadF/BadG/BcrA/BcrD type ATPase [Collinsella sp. AGMB00827]|uniref:BadF/BadG/BcrA/BcrD type ATPase n=1 Tax=Collinsella ureilytica TaxID=2869515 RepID=A0ABS7MIG2_9ACTN|nr:BadF/BadG/BcrA/BcrD ATPase family protein [Collinsella urealyticum]MBY4797154.1 BadF/BadG/BcrA/BcrD type ATPase [Collinsella urealyticum]